MLLFLLFTGSANVVNLKNEKKSTQSALNANILSVRNTGRPAQLWHVLTSVAMATYESVLLL